MQLSGFGLLRILLPRTRMSKGKKKGIERARAVKPRLLATLPHRCS
jgi:hypothetical protein